MGNSLVVLIVLLVGLVLVRCFLRVGVDGVVWFTFWSVPAMGF